MKWLCIAGLALFLMVSVLVSLFYFPPFQRRAVRMATTVVSEQTGMDIHIGSIGLRFPLDIALGDVIIVKDGDTLLDVRQVSADIGLLPLLQGRVEVKRLELENGRLDLSDLITSAEVKGHFGRLTAEGDGEAD